MQQGYSEDCWVLHGCADSLGQHRLLLLCGATFNVRNCCAAVGTGW